MTKLIVLRGNSGSGKSVVAREVQSRVEPHPVLIEHDHFRRKILKEKEGPDSINADLIYRTVAYAFEHDRDVIIEGIMRMKYYSNLFDRLIQLNQGETYFYYFDVSFDETLRRHNSKNNVDFGEVEMKRWYMPNDYTGYDTEIAILESNTLEDTVSQIISQTGFNTRISS
ncbi:MAG: Valyl-tRNA synthetase [Candidatus Saccharibacteria bacterium]|jgi:adenylate kinase family enzyme|nr:Valyl-tRNA synthetase [Candidatus Saccharibacteria bacterium]